MRTFDDTQIYYEYGDKDYKLSDKETECIVESITYGTTWTLHDDKANGLLAVHISVSQKTNPEYGEVLVDKLNELCEENGIDGKWYLGDIDEEYVFVD